MSMDWTATLGLARRPAVTEAADALARSVCAPLSHLGLLRASGDDAAGFLQGQLSSDLRQLTPPRAQLSSFNSAKGRMLAVLHLYRDATSIWLETRSEVAPSLLQRLRLFVLRSRVALADASTERVALGVSGPDAGAALAGAGLPAPEAVLQAAWQDETCVIRRQDAGARPRYTVHLPIGTVTRTWEALAARLQPVGADAWRLLDIEAGLPCVTAATRDLFVPQMCNLDRLGGISFEKGCYTGQEIVARVHYRGAIKRHMVAIDHPDAHLQAGARLDAPPGAEVVDAAPAPGGGARALVVVTVGAG